MKFLIPLVAFALCLVQCEPGGETLSTTRPLKPRVTPSAGEQNQPNLPKIKAQVTRGGIPLHLPPTVRTCSAVSAPRYRRQVHYNLGTITVRPLPYGPQIADRPAPSAPVSLTEIVAAMRQLPLPLCTSLMGRRRRAGCRLAVDLRVGPDGRYVQSAVRPLHKKCRKVATCIDAKLHHFRLSRLPIRTTKASFHVLLEAPATGGGKHSMRQQVRFTPQLRDGCLVSPKGVTDTVSTTAIVLRVPSSGWSGDARSGVLPHTVLRRPFTYNLGAYRRCYVDALARVPGLRGRVTLTGHPRMSGEFQLKIAKSEVSEARLNACLLRAASRVRLLPLHDSPRYQLSPRGATVTIGFMLKPGGRTLDRSLNAATAHQVETRAQRALIARDGLLALRLYEALLVQLPGHARMCHWRLGYARGVLLKYPWRGPRFAKAVEAIVSGVRPPKSREERICFAATREFLIEKAPPVDRIKLGMPYGEADTLIWRGYRLTFAINDLERRELLEEVAAYHELNSRFQRATTALTRALGLARTKESKGRLAASLDRVRRHL